MLAVMLLSQHQVLSSKTVRPRAPCGARCMEYASGSQTFFVHGVLQKLINTRGALMKPKFQILSFTKKLYLNHVHYSKCTKMSALFAKY